VDDKPDGAPRIPLLVEEDMTRAFFTAIDQAPSGEAVYVPSSYTALRALRRDLVRRGFLTSFWRQTSAAPGARDVPHAEEGQQADEARSVAR